ncbi:hypothetical protein [Acinetobacter pittii]|uniref:hypothetical protein n=1 Tax=Acinetobacter pittii TaxID=48296 RepID=UPI002AFEC76E|nr:hypothetical protein [Acinetobacter pittii]
MSFAQYFDFGLITVCILYIGGCRLHLYKIMPVVTKALENPANDKIIERNYLKLLCNIPFSIICLLFILWRFHVALAAHQVEGVTSWVIPILLGLYGAYILFFHSIFSLVAAKSKPTVWRGE